MSRDYPASRPVPLDQADGLRRLFAASRLRFVPVLSKIDEAVKLGPALDALIRHKARLLGVANGQRVPEDWHRLSASALVQRAMRAPSAGAWQMDRDDVSLVFAAMPAAATAAAMHA